MAEIGTALGAPLYTQGLISPIGAHLSFYRMGLNAFQAKNDYFLTNTTSIIKNLINMKNLSILFLFVFGCLAANAQVGNPHEFAYPCLGNEPSLPQIVEVDFIWSNECQGFTWNVIVCNNSETCPTIPFTLEVQFELSPFQFENLPPIQSGSLYPGQCKTISRTIESTPHPEAYMRVELVETGQELIYGEECF